MNKLKWLFCFGCMAYHYHELQSGGEYKCPDCHFKREDENTGDK